MAVSKASTSTYTLSGVFVDMDTPCLDLTFTLSVDGVNVSVEKFHLAGDAFNAIFGAMPSEGLTRAADLSVALYQAALTAGVISGKLS